MKIDWAEIIYGEEEPNKKKEVEENLSEVSDLINSYLEKHCPDCRRSLEIKIGCYYCSDCKQEFDWGLEKI